MRKVLIIFLVVSAKVFSQQYTFIADLKAEHYQYKDTIKQTNFKPFKATIIITEDKCVITEENSIKTYYIRGSELDLSLQRTVVIRAIRNDIEYDLRLINNGDNSFHFLVTNYRESYLYRLLGVKKR